MEYQPISSQHIESALELVLSAYKEERAAIPFLPQVNDFKDILRQQISKLFSRASGVAAISQGKLMGFLAGTETGELWGKSQGVYVPIYGHGAVKEDRSSIYQGLYSQAAQIWVNNQRYTHAITFFAHDKQTIDTWFWMGFGMRCVDSIAQVAPLSVASNPAIEIRKGTESDYQELKDILNEFSEFWPKSPTFVPKGKEDPVQSYIDRMDVDSHYWIAYLDNKPVGQIRIQPEAETFVAGHKDVMNITSAYVAEAGRHSGIGLLLLAEVMKWLDKNNYPLCGVDFESINIPGSRFWKHYFTPYTYSLVRRIDERL